MAEKNFHERVEDVLYRMGLRTFDPPLTLDYRFGSIEAEIGAFRCFVNQDDVMKAPSYLEIHGDHIYWVALQYPGLEAFMESVKKIGQRCFKTLGRLHTVIFIIVAENGFPTDERISLDEFFTEHSRQLFHGTYHLLEIWDEEGLKKREEQTADLIE